MAQLPPDSQRATWSHSPSVAAPACPARARLPLPMTAPVKAIFATFTADVVGLRCRPLIGALGPLFCAREVSCRVRAGEVARPVPSKQHRLHPKEPHAAPGPDDSVDRWVPRLHPSCSSLAVRQRMELGAVEARWANRLRVDGLGLNRNGPGGWRHLLTNSALRLQANLKNALNHHDAT